MIAGVPIIPVKASSQGSGDGLTKSPVGSPSEPRCNILFAAKSITALPPRSKSRANQGCRPNQAGKSHSPGSYSSDQRIASSNTSIVCSKVAPP